MSSPFLFDPTNFLVLPSQIINAFRYGDWKRAWKRGGLAGVLAELAGAITNFNCMPFFVPTDSRIAANGLEVGNPGGHWNQARVRDLLARYGVRSWSYGYFRREMHFMVERRQGEWAQYIMLRAGVPLLHGYVPGPRAIPGPAAMAQGLPPAWADGPAQTMRAEDAERKPERQPGQARRILRDLW